MTISEAIASSAHVLVEHAAKMANDLHERYQTGSAPEAQPETFSQPVQQPGRLSGRPFHLGVSREFRCHGDLIE